MKTLSAFDTGGWGRAVGRPYCCQAVSSSASCRRRPTSTSAILPVEYRCVVSGLAAEILSAVAISTSSFVRAAPGGRGRLPSSLRWSPILMGGQRRFRTLILAPPAVRATSKASLRRFPVGRCDVGSGAGRQLPSRHVHQARCRRRCDEHRFRLPTPISSATSSAGLPEPGCPVGSACVAVGTGSCDGGNAVEPGRLALIGMALLAAS